MTTLKTIQNIYSNFLLIQPCRWSFLLYIETIYLYTLLSYHLYIFVSFKPPWNVYKIKMASLWWALSSIFTRNEFFDLFRSVMNCRNLRKLFTSEIDWTVLLQKNQMCLIDKNRYRKSIRLISLWYTKSIEIEVTEKIIYRLLSINKIMKVIDRNRQ